MSIASTPRRTMAPDIKALKGKRRVVTLTAYHAPTAAIADKYCDVLLVGDSVGMVMHGFATTLPVTLELMILHARAVVAGSSSALVVVDMPFASYEESPQVAFRNAARVLKETGCGAVKLEGGLRMRETIRFLVERGIPVMGHVGMTPQSINTLGGFKTQGRKRGDWAHIEAEAKATQEAGAFAVVLEAMAPELAERITQGLSIPSIGIGASAACDGQVLVMEDMLGLTEKVPKFVRKYANLGSEIDRAIAEYARQVRSGAFPGPEHVYDGPPQVASSSEPGPGQAKPRRRVMKKPKKPRTKS